MKAGLRQNGYSEGAAKPSTASRKVLARSPFTSSYNALEQEFQAHFVNTNVLDRLGHILTNPPRVKT
jgi:hypothetical protein